MAPPAPDQIGFNDRLLAEAMRLYEEDGRRPLDDPIAQLHAQSIEGDLEAKIISRANSSQMAGDLRRSLRTVRASVGWSVTAAVLLTFLLGAATARATLGTATDGVVNFYWVLGGVLGVQTFALIAWLIVMLGTAIAHLRSIRSGGASVSGASGIISLGAAVLTAAQWLASRFAREAHQAAAVAAAARVNASGALGRWTFSAVTHLLWLSFNVGCLALVFYLLATRHYTFVWETTILSPDRYVMLTRGIAALPDRCGIITPSREQIRNSQSPPPADATAPASQASEAWAGLLVGSLVLYGFGPRLLLLGYSLGRRRTQRNRYRLDLSMSGYARLEHKLMPRSASMGILSQDADPNQIAPHEPQRRETVRPVSAAHAIVGYEIERPHHAGWPPSLHGIEWDDLGIIEDGRDRRAVLSRLDSSEMEPASLVIVCGLTTTPDRGIERFLTEAISRIRQPAALILTGGQAMRERGMDAERIGQRTSDWRALAVRAGIEPGRIIEIDLDRLTDTSRRRMKSLITGDRNEQSADMRLIDRAFELIANEATTWAESTRRASVDSQAELHRRIASLYGSEDASWRKLLGAGPSLKGDFAAQIRSSAQRMQALLPDRLKRSPKWIAAGALGGALGCVAAATFISPVAIGALPMWSGIGAAITTIWQPRKEKANEEQDQGAHAPTDAHFGDAVRAAALFALVLELQGRDEASITRSIDEAIGPHPDRVIHSAQQTRDWLDGVRHRFDLSMARKDEAPR